MHNRVQNFASLGLVLVCLLLCQGLQAQIGLRARLDSAAMTIGDPNRIEVTISGTDLPARVDWAVLDTMAALSFTRDEQQSGTGSERKYALAFSVYDSVGILFPQLPVYIADDTFYTNDLALLVDFPAADTVLHSYRPLDVEPSRLSDYLPWLIGGLVALLLLVGAFYFFYFAREEQAPARPVFVAPAHEVALAAIAVLRKRTDLTDKAYYSELDRILRSYLEDRYQVPALEQTSREVVATLRSQSLPDVAELTDLLSQVDLVKFAKAELPAERRLAAASRVTDFVKATIPPPPITPEV